MSGPAWTLSNSRQSSTVLAIGPSTLRRLCQPIVLGTMGEEFEGVAGRSAILPVSYTHLTLPTNREV